MLVSLTNARIDLLHVFWGIAIFFLSLSALLCLGIVFRRVLKNHKMKFREKEKILFQAYVLDSLQISEGQIDFSSIPECHIDDITDIFLHNFQTLKGNKRAILQDLISNSNLENRIRDRTQKGTRGARMRAVRVLSYLNTQNSLQVIFRSLSSEDKYIRLTAMRSLVKRDASFFLDAIIESCLDAFPADHNLLAGIISNFRADITEDLEGLIQTSDDPVLVAGCLETLSLIMPMETAVDFGNLMENPDKIVRAAALSLSSITKNNAVVEPIVLGLRDTATHVKIRAAKAANSLKRSDLTSELFKLTDDPVLWVRYWAFRGIWVSGQSGQKLVISMRESHEMAGKVAKEMRSGYV